MKRLLLFSLIITMVVGVSAKPMTRKSLATYASSLKGKNKAELKKAVYSLIYPNKVLEYGRGPGHTWDGFYKTDRYDGNKCRDRYSNKVFTFKSPTVAPEGMNIEHSFPKSWWGGDINNAYNDLYNLMPSESRINSSKNNYGMGKVGKTNVDNGCTKVGKGVGDMERKNLWEPANKWKGDFSRGYLYMATAHQHLNKKYTGEGLTSLEKNEWPTLQKWAYTLYMEWSRNDKVDQIEVDRNNSVHDIQGIRNLFVDYPMLAEYIWGDSINVAFDPAQSITTASDDDRYARYEPVDPGETPGGDDEPTIDEPGTDDDVIVTGDEVNVTFEFSNPATIGIVEPSKGTGSELGTKTYSRNGIKLSATSANSNTPTRIWNSNGVITLRVYTGSTITFTAPEGYVIGKVVFKYGKSCFASANVGVLSGDGESWTGNDATVIFTADSGVFVVSADVTLLKLQQTTIDAPVVGFETDVIYNIAGQVVDDDYKGIVIKNGKKYQKK